MRPRKRRLKKLRPLIHTSATTKVGKNPIMAQLLVIAAPPTKAARSNQDSRSSIRYSSKQRITYANSTRSSISQPEPQGGGGDEMDVACSQKVSCKPHRSEER